MDFQNFSFLFEEVVILCIHKIFLFFFSRLVFDDSAFLFLLHISHAASLEAPTCDANIMTILYIYQGAGGATHSSHLLHRKELVPVITWIDLFTFIIMLCAVITLVRNDKHKK